MTVNLHDVPALQRVPVREGVVLRPLAEADAVGILAVLDADPAIRERVTVAAKLHSVADVRQEIADSRASGDFVRYVLALDGVIAGMVSLWRDRGFFGQEPTPDAYGFGYFLAPSARGKGLITDSVRALMGVVQQNLPVAQFMAFCEDSNPGSTAVLKRLGLEPTETTYSEPNHGWAERLYVKAVGGI